MTTFKTDYIYRCRIITMIISYKNAVLKSEWEKKIIYMKD